MSGCASASLPAFLKDLPADSLRLPSHVCLPPSLCASASFSKDSNLPLPSPPTPPPHRRVNITPGAQRFKQQRKKGSEEQRNTPIYNVLFLPEEMEAAAAAAGCTELCDGKQREEEEDTNIFWLFVAILALFF